MDCEIEMYNYTKGIIEILTNMRCKKKFPKLKFISDMNFDIFWSSNFKIIFF